MKKLVAILLLITATSAFAYTDYTKQTQQSCNTYCTEIAGSNTCNTVCTQ